MVPYSGVIPLLFDAVSTTLQGGGWTFDDLRLLCILFSLFVSTLLLRAKPTSTPSETKPPNPEQVNFAEVLGTAYPWRSCRVKRKRNPRHYYLYRKALARLLSKRKKPIPSVPRKTKPKKPPKPEQVPHHWQHPSDEERLEDWDLCKHKYLHRSEIMLEAQYGIDFDGFMRSIDPLKQFKALKILSDPQLPLLRTARTPIKGIITQAKAEARMLNSALIAAIDLEAVSSVFPRIQNPLGTNKIQSTSGSYQSVYHSHDTPTPIVIDTGASVTVTPHKSDFVSPIRTTKLKNLNTLAGETSVEGEGVVEWTIRDLYGAVQTIQTTAFYVPKAQIRLFSPQRYFQENAAGQLTVSAKYTVLTMPDSLSLTFPYQPNNIPMMLEGQRHISAGLSFEEVTFLTSPDIGASLSVVDENNQNLTVAEKELLLLHFKYGHAHFQWIQRLLAKPRSGEAPILPCKHKGASTTQRNILCAACELGKQSRRTPPSEHSTHDETMAIRSGDTVPGAKVSMDNYISSLPGRQPHTKGKEKPDSKFNGGTIFCDHASSAMYAVNQISLRAGETTQAKIRYEQWAKSNNVPHILSYRADNVPFNSERFMEDIRLKNQTIDFSGANAHHQNAVAERAIQTVTKWARTLLLHTVIHWPDQADLSLWPFAIEHAVYIWNHLPRRDIQLSPLELFSQTKMPNRDALSRLHVWGCPMYVLDPKLANGKSLPKWSPRSRRGMYLGHSPQHSSTVSRVLNLQTGHVSPQYHVVADDTFSTVPTSDSGTALFDPDHFDPTTWSKLLESGYEFHLDDVDRDEHGRPLFPPLSDDWLTPDERSLRQRRRAAIDARRRLRHRLTRPDLLPNPGGTGPNAQPNEPPIPLVMDPFESQPEPRNNQPDEQDDDPIEFLPNQDDPNEDDLRSVPEGAETEDDELEPPQTVPEMEDEDPQEVPDANEEEPVRRSKRMRQRPRFHGGNQDWQVNNLQKKFRHSELNRQFLATLNWTKVVDQLQSPQFAKMWSMCTQEMDHDLGTFEWLHPLILTAKANAEDNPSWEEAMNGPLAEGYWKAAEKEIKTLEAMDVWEVVERQEWMNVIPSTWAFKCKRFPDGQVRKLKGRFCVRGDRQVDGVDYDSNQIFSPVVSWHTVRLLLILSIVLNLATKQVDYTAAFVHAPIGDKDVYVEMPRGFKEPGKVLRLKKSLYGLKQAPINFFKFIKGKLEKTGFTSNEDVDPCLFISDKVICLVYVDDTLLFSPKEEYIDEAIKKLEEEGVAIEVEDSVAGFLGVHIERDESNHSIKMTQAGLAKRIVDTLDISHAPLKYTPAVREPLAKDPDGDPPDGTYSYPSVVGMLLYLSGHSRPDIQFAVSQVARFIHGTKRSHEMALERIGQYLKGTMQEGLILRPNGNFDFEVHVDADFAGLYALEDVFDPSCVKSRTGYVVSFSGCPVLWVSRLQTDIALSTMESEYNALSTAMKDLLPLRTLFESVAHGVGLTNEVKTTFKTTVWEDNMGCLKLANLSPGQYTPRSKHYAVKYHWFRSHLQPARTVVKYVESSMQKADILTKGLVKAKFEEIRKLLCGW